MSKNKISTTIDLTLLAKVHGGAQVKTKTTGSLGWKKVGLNGERETETTESDHGKCLNDNRESVCRATKGLIFKTPSRQDADDCVRNLKSLCGDPPKSGD